MGDKDIIKMNIKELKRLHVINKVLEKQMMQVEAAPILNIPDGIDYLDRISACIRTLIASTDYEEMKTWNPSVRKHYRQSSHLKAVGTKGYPDSGYPGGSLA